MSEEEEKTEKTDKQGQAKGGLTGHLKKHWYLYVAGFGVAMIIIYIVGLKKQANNANSSGMTYSYGPTPTVGNDGSASNSDYSSIMSMLEGQQYSNQQMSTSISNLGTQFASAETQLAQSISQLAGGQPNTTPSPTTTDNVNLYTGLLGPNVSMQVAQSKFPGQHLIQGNQGRIWIVQNGIQNLVTSGKGAPVTNSGLPVGSPENTPGAMG